MARAFSFMIDCQMRKVADVKPAVPIDQCYLFVAAAAGGASTPLNMSAT